MPDLPDYEKTHLSKLMVLRSADVDDSNPADFTVDIGDGSDFSHVKRIVLRSMFFTNLEYNINSKNNSMSITTDEAGFEGPFVVTVPVGQYNITTLLAAMKVALDATAGAVTFSSVAPVAPTYLLSVSISAGTFVFNETANSIYDTIGFVSFPQSALATQTTGAVVQLHGLTRIYVKSNELANANCHDSNENQPNTIAVIPVTAVFGSQNHYETNDDELTSINFEQKRGKGLKRIDIQLHDQNDLPLELNGAHVELVFKVYF